MAIGSRLSRQQEAPSSIRINTNMIVHRDRRSAEAFYSIMQVNPASVKVLAVDTTRGEDWKLVARGMRLQPGAVNKVVTTKPDLDSAVRTRSSDAKRNNIKEIWDAVGPEGFTIYSQRITGPVPRAETIKKSQAGWTRLEQILDMSHNEFAKI